MPTISVIVPVYNTEEHVGRCLESILGQTFTDLEIIVLNDGSPDQAEAVIQMYAEQDERIRYYRHANIGLGPTRNRGMELAQGSYLAFVDSDDYILPTMLEDLYAAAQQNRADVVCGEMYIMDEAGNILNHKKRLDTVVELTEETMGQFMADYYFGRMYAYSACDKLYRTELIKQNAIHFGDNRRVFSEDNYFQVQVLNHARRIAFIAKPIYCYIQHPGSIMNSQRKDILSRQLHFTHDLLAKYCHREREWLDKALSIICFDSIYTQAHNHIAYETDNKIVVRELKEDMTLFRQDTYYPAFRKSLIEQKGYRYDPNPKRRLYMWVFSFLLERGWLSLTTLFLCLPHWLRGVSGRGGAL